MRTPSPSIIAKYLPNTDPTMIRTWPEFNRARELEKQAVLAEMQRQATRTANAMGYADMNGTPLNRARTLAERLEALCMSRYTPRRLAALVRGWSVGK